MGGGGDRPPGFEFPFTTTASRSGVWHISQSGSVEGSYFLVSTSDKATWLHADRSAGGRGGGRNGRSTGARALADYLSRGSSVQARSRAARRVSAPAAISFRALRGTSPRPVRCRCGVGLDVRIERPGHVVSEAQQAFRTERVFASIFVVGVIGFAIDLGFRRPRQWLLPWHRETES